MQKRLCSTFRRGFVFVFLHQLSPTVPPTGVSTTYLLTYLVTTSAITMKGTRTAIVGALLAGASSSHAAHSGNGVVQWDIRKDRQPQDFTKLRRRADTYEEIVTNEQARGGYFATCKLGTPGQDLTLQLDTGSSDIWVPDSSAQVCRKANSGGCTFGTCMDIPCRGQRRLQVG